LLDPAVKKIFIEQDKLLLGQFHFNIIAFSVKVFSYILQE
jgi:hypothetical protein